MSNPLSDSRIPLAVRLAVSNAALEYAAALVNGDSFDITINRGALLEAVEDCKTCLKAAELGM